MAYYLSILTNCDESVKNWELILFYFNFCRSYAPGKNSGNNNGKNMIYAQNRGILVLFYTIKKIPVFRVIQTYLKGYVH